MNLPVLNSGKNLWISHNPKRMSDSDFIKTIPIFTNGNGSIRFNYFTNNFKVLLLPALSVSSNI